MASFIITQKYKYIFYISINNNNNTIFIIYSKNINTINIKIIKKILKIKCNYIRLKITKFSNILYLKKIS